mgnify:FL=1
MSLLKVIQEKIKVAFNAALTDEEKKVLKDYHAKLESENMPKTLNTKEGKVLNYVGELEKGTPLTSPAVDGASAQAEDGTYEIAGGEMDGTVITVMDGMIEDVKPKVVMPVDTPLLSNEVKEQMEAKFSAQKSDLEKAIEAKFASEKADLIAEMKELKENYKVVYSALDKIMNTPIDTTHNAPKKTYEEMNKREQFLFNRGKL